MSNLQLLLLALKRKYPHLDAQMDQSVTIFFESLKQALQEHKRIEIRGLGVFEVKQRKNFIVHFKPSSSWLDGINE